MHAVVEKAPQPADPINIVLPAEAKPESRPDEVIEPLKPAPEITLFDLLRYAMQVRHSPKRLVDPIRVQGRLLASAFHSRYLLAGQRTTLAVVTAHPFPAAIGGVR